MLELALGLVWVVVRCGVGDKVEIKFSVEVEVRFGV